MIKALTTYKSHRNASRAVTLHVADGHVTYMVEHLDEKGQPECYAGPFGAPEWLFADRFPTLV